MVSINKPRVRTQGQTIYTADGSVKFHLSWNRYSDRVATFSSLENPYHWEHGFCTYLGLPTKAVALAWQQHLLRTGLAKVAEVRKVNRLKTGTPKGVTIRWELKLRGLTYEQLVDLLTFDLTQVAPEPEQKPTATDFEVGARVKVINTFGGPNDHRTGSLATVVSSDDKINTIEVRVDGALLGSLLLKPEWAVKVDREASTEQPEAPEQAEASIEQPESAYVSIDVNDVPRGISLQETNDDLLVEYNVWVWVIVNEKGVPTLNQRHIGRLVEGMGGIEAFRPRSGFSQAFSRTFDAASYLLRASGYRTSDIELALQMNEQDPPTPAAVRQQPERGGLRQRPEATEDKKANMPTESEVEGAKESKYLEQNSQLDPQIFQVGDRVEINSDRHGVEFDWQIGMVSVATAV